MKTLKRYIKLEVLFIKYSLKEQAIYKFNFFMGIISDIVFLCVNLVYYFVFYQSNISIEGLNYNELLLFIGTNYLIVSLYVVFFYRNIHLELPENVASGNFDLLITKPISLQFISSMKHAEFATNIAGIIGGIILIFTSCVRMKRKINFGNVMIYILLVFLGIMVMYSVFLIIHSLCFKMINIGSITNFIWEIMVINKMPMFIYNKCMQFFGTIIFPVFLFSNLPYIYICKLKSMRYIVLCIGISFGFFMLSKIVWRKAVSKYSSASS